MSDKFVFQNARIKSMESKLLSSQIMQRLSECGSESDAFKILSEAGYGAGAGSDIRSVDALLKKEEEAACSLIKNFNADSQLDVFLLYYDYHNLKALIKASVASENNPVLMPEGLFEVSKLNAAVISNDVSDLPEDMAKAVKDIARLITEDRISPRLIDEIVDKAYFDDAAKRVKSDSAHIKRYFEYKADFINIGAFLRCKKLNLDDRFFSEGFVSGGSIDKSVFDVCFGSTLDVFSEKFVYTPYRQIVSEAVDSGNLAKFEKDCDDALFSIFKEKNDDMFSEAPLVSYYLGKLAEIKAVKLTVAGVKNKVSPELIKERLRMTYAK